MPDEDPDSILDTLLTECAPPVLNRVVRSRLGGLYTPLNADELTSEATLELLSRLRALRAGSGSHANASLNALPFDALAAGVAANTVHRFFARRFPERDRLRKKLRYIMGTSDRFRVWRDASGSSVCALTPSGGHLRVNEGQRTANAAESERTANAADVERCVERIRRHPVPFQPMGTLVFEILRILGCPVDLSRLTALVADLTGLREPTWISTSPLPDEGFAAQDLPTDAPSVAVRLEMRERLHRLWPEVLLLSVRHRLALLLSARGPGDAVVWLLVDLGVVTFRQIAAALEMTPDGLSEIWNRLPLDDREIGARLGLERQQVINLRRTARERLARREIALAHSPEPIAKRNRS
jgi:hypothetical protein